MIDINNSQKFDNETYQEELKEERQKQGNPRTSGLGILAPPPTLGNPITGGLGMLTPSPFGNALSSGLGMFVPQVSLDSQLVLDAVSARARDELTDPIDYMKRIFPNRKLWRFVLTHPDLDHMRGLKNLQENVGFDNFWDTDHTKPQPDYRNDADKEDWEFYQKLRAGNVGPGIKKYTRGDSYFAFGKEEGGLPGGDAIEILSPTRELVGACNTADKSNDLSIVLRVHHGGRTVLLPGDAEALAWQDMLAFYGARLKSDFLKASHHGRDSGYHLESLKAINPLMAFVSVGTKPDTDASNKYRPQTMLGKVPSTRYYGNVTLHIFDDGSWKWYVDRNANNS